MFGDGRTLVERKARHTILVPIRGDYTAQWVGDALKIINIWGWVGQVGEQTYDIGRNGVLSTGWAGRSGE